MTDILPQGEPARGEGQEESLSTVTMLLSEEAFARAGWGETIEERALSLLKEIVVVVPETDMRYGDCTYCGGKIEYSRPTNMSMPCTNPKCPRVKALALLAEAQGQAAAPGASGEGGGR